MCGLDTKAAQHGLIQGHGVGTASPVLSKLLFNGSVRGATFMDFKTSPWGSSILHVNDLHDSCWWFK